METSSLNSKSEARAKHQTETLRFTWLDLIRTAALIWIFLKHSAEQIFGHPNLANPRSGWPPLSGRLAQLQPLDGLGLWIVLANLLRYIGWSGAHCFSETWERELGILTDHEYHFPDQSLLATAWPAASRKGEQDYRLGAECFEAHRPSYLVPAGLLTALVSMTRPISPRTLT